MEQEQKQEQAARFDSMRELADRAQAAVASIRDLTTDQLKQVDSDSSLQAESLQRISQSAGSAVDVLQQIEALARRSRSFQAQEHQDHTSDRPR